MPVAKNPYRPLEVSELSWILEQKIRGETDEPQAQEKSIEKPRAKSLKQEVKVEEVIVAQPKKRGRKPKATK